MLYSSFTIIKMLKTAVTKSADDFFWWGGVERLVQKSHGYSWFEQDASC